MQTSSFLPKKLENVKVLTKAKDFTEGSLEVKLPTIWRDEKQSREVESEARRYTGARYSRAKC